MDDIECYLLLKYGTIDRAFGVWINSSSIDDSDPEMYEAIGNFFRGYFDERGHRSDVNPEIR